MVIDGYYIDGYWWYWWLLLIIVLRIIGDILCYIIIGYW